MVGDGDGDGVTAAEEPSEVKRVAQPAIRQQHPGLADSVYGVKQDMECIAMVASRVKDFAGYGAWLYR